MPTVRQTVGPRNPVSTPGSTLAVRAIEPPPGGPRRKINDAASHRGNYVAVTLSPHPDQCQWSPEKTGKAGSSPCSEGVRAEVFRAHRLDELSELLYLGLFVLIVDDDAGVGQDIGCGKDRYRRPDGERDRVARPARNGVIRAVARHLER